MTRNRDSAQMTWGVLGASPQFSGSQNGIAMENRHRRRESTGAAGKVSAGVHSLVSRVVLKRKYRRGVGACLLRGDSVWPSHGGPRSPRRACLGSFSAAAIRGGRAAGMGGGGAAGECS